MGTRIWEQFLTPQDRAHLERVPRAGQTFGSRPALLLIDLYRWVFGDKPEPLVDAVSKWPASCGLAAWEALPRIERLLRTSRESSILVIHVTGGISGVPPWRDMRTVVDSSAKEAGAEDRQARMYDIVEEVAPTDGEPVLRKSSPSAFWGTPLVGLLNHHRIDTVVVAGESTSGCVRATVVDGRTYRFNMVVVEDCVFDRHEASHAISLFDMDQKYADVMPLSTVTDHLQSRAKGS